MWNYPPLLRLRPRPPTNLLSSSLKFLTKLAAISLSNFMILIMKGRKKTQALFYYWTTEMICFFKFCSNFQRSYRVCMRRNHQYYYYNLKMSHFLRPYPPQNRKKMSLHPNERKNKHNSLEKHRSNATFRKNVSAKIWSKFQGLQNSNGRLNGPLLPIGVPYLWSWYPYWSFKAYWNFPHILAHFTQRCLVM